VTRGRDNMGIFRQMGHFSNVLVVLGDRSQSVGSLWG
jgi:hypothetical protein